MSNPNSVAPSSSPQKVHAMVCPTPDANPEDFSRRLKISSFSPPRPCQSTKAKKLFNPDTDPIPMRPTADPESMLESTGPQQGTHPLPSSTNHRDVRGNTSRHLFDPQNDDPVRFSVMARPQVLAYGYPSPTPKCSGDYVSASSTLSYTASVSSFTLSSTSSALFDGRPNQDQAGTNQTSKPKSNRKILWTTPTMLCAAESYSWVEIENDDLEKG